MSASEGWPTPSALSTPSIDSSSPPSWRPLRAPWGEADPPPQPEGWNGSPNRAYGAAKRDEGRRFRALYDQIYGGDVLREAWKRVRVREGAGGVD